MKRLSALSLLVLGLSCFTAGEVEAGPYYSLTMGTSSATLRMVGKIAVGRSTLTANTAEIQIGPGGGVQASSFTATYGVAAATANFTSSVTAGGLAAGIVAVGVDLSAVYGVRSATAVVSGTTTVGGVAARVVSVGVDLSADYGVRAATGAFSTGVTVGTLSVTGSADFAGNVTVSSENATAMFQVLPGGVVKSTTQPAARWVRTSAISTADGANHVLTFTIKDYNTQSLFDVSHATIPAAGDGYYWAKCSVNWATNTTGRRAVSVYKNGSADAGAVNTVAPVTGDETKAMSQLIQHYVAGDTISCGAFQNSGGALNVNQATVEVLRIW